MLGKYKFIKGQRVQPSELGVQALLFRGHENASGIVLSVDNFNCPKVLWDHRKTASSYHPDFIAPYARQRKEKADERSEC